MSAEADLAESSIGARSGSKGNWQIEWCWGEKIMIVPVWYGPEMPASRIHFDVHPIHLYINHPTDLEVVHIACSSIEDHSNAGREIDSTWNARQVHPFGPF